MQQSLWLQSASPFQTTSLHNDITCDVCIVGGGLSGFILPVIGTSRV